MWKYKNKTNIQLSDLPDDIIGFVYLITNTTNGKKYIGKKNVLSWKVIGQKKYEELKLIGEFVKKHKNKNQSVKGDPIWVYQLRIEGNWQNYTGSCKELNDDIKKGDKIQKEIIATANCSKQLTYLELEQHIIKDVLRNNSEYYNQNILGKFWPKDLNC